MSKGALNLTSDNEYYTPYSVIKYFGDFDYDPSTTIEKAKEFNIGSFDTIETDGLKNDWSNYHKIWINPPFTMKKEFISKAVYTYKIDKSKEIYILVPITFLTTKIFHNIIKDVGFKLYIPSGRINFESGLGKKSKSPAFGTVIIVLQDKMEIELLDIKKLLP